jgi:hypothetical protein
MSEVIEQPGEPKVGDFVMTYRHERGVRHPVRGQITERRYAFVKVAYYFHYDNGGDVLHGFRTLRRKLTDVVVVERLPGELSPYEKIDKAFGVRRKRDDALTAGSAS